MNSFRIAIIVSRFNEEITSKLRGGATDRLKELNLIGQVFEVPGAVEIPITAQSLAESKKFDAIIALGAVIRGETDHYDWVCHIVSEGCLRVSLDQKIPVIFGVLTTDTEEQALDRVGGRHGHKGKEAVDTALEMIQLLRRITPY